MEDSSAPKVFTEDLRNDKIYTLKQFCSVLKTHGFPGTPYWVRQIEKKKYIKSSALPTSDSPKTPRYYTGKQIKKCIIKLLKRVESADVSKKAN